jgi:hypothetical protein
LGHSSQVMMHNDALMMHFESRILSACNTCLAPSVLFGMTLMIASLRLYPTVPSSDTPVHFLLSLGSPLLSSK